MGGTYQQKSQKISGIKIGTVKIKIHLQIWTSLTVVINENKNETKITLES